MNRRVFLALMSTVFGSVMVRSRAMGQAARPIQTASSQPEVIRMAAEGFLQTLAPDRRQRVMFPFPAGQSPIAIGFAGRGGPPNLGGLARAAHRNIVFDTDGHASVVDDRGGDQAMSGPGSPSAGHGDNGPNSGPGAVPLAAGEKYGDAVWTNFPVNDVPRPGLRMGELTQAERDAAHDLLQRVLSPLGYQKVLDIMAADQLVADAGSDYLAGFDTYTIGFFGEPDSTTPWMLQFGGHHLGINVTFVGEQAVLSPLHTGILPARFEADGKGQGIRSRRHVHTPATHSRSDRSRHQ